MLSIPSVTGEDVKEQLLTISESAGPHSLHLRSLKNGQESPGAANLVDLFVCYF